MAQYRCRCGHVFDEALGKYGCPNCEGASGAAKWFNSEAHMSAKTMQGTRVQIDPDDIRLQAGEYGKLDDSVCHTGAKRFGTIVWLATTQRSTHEARHHGS